MKDKKVTSLFWGLAFKLSLFIPLMAEEPQVLTWFLGEKENSSFGFSVSGAGDVNGDGFADFLIGAPGVKCAYLYLGGNSLTESFILAQDADSFGYGVTGIGNFNGDGFDDFLVTSRNSKIYLFYGGVNPDTTPDLVFDLTNFLEAQGVGDLNRDDYEDLAIITPGRLNIYLGGSLDTVADFTISSEAKYIFTSVRGAGDINNDGFDDFLTSSLEIGQNRSKICLYLGKENLNIYPDLTIYYMGINSGRVTLAGGYDLNNDAYDDLILGGDNGNFIYWGGREMDTLADLSLSVSSLYKITALGDINNDGAADLLGATYGKVYLFYGGDKKLNQVDSIMSSTYGDGFGMATSGAFDVNGDNFRDFLIAAPRTSWAGASVGKVYLYSFNNPYPPNLEVTPSAYQIKVKTGATISPPLTIYNSGKGELVFSLKKSAAWLEIQQQENKIFSGDSLILNINFNALSLYPGEYKDTLIITTNDPHNLTTSIPITLLITPDLALKLEPVNLKDNLEFKTTYLNYGLDATVQIIFSVYSQADSVIINSQNKKLTPGESKVSYTIFPPRDVATDESYLLVIKSVYPPFSGEIIAQDSFAFEVTQGNPFLNSPIWRLVELGAGEESERTRQTFYKLELMPPYPNPFKGGVQFIFTIPYFTSENLLTTIKIYDLKGSLIRTIIQNEAKTFGMYRVSWDGKDEKGRRVGEGIYLVSLKLGTWQVSQKLISLGY